MADDVLIGQLVAKVEANTKQFEAALVRMEAMTMASTQKSSKDFDKVSHSVDRLGDRLIDAGKSAILFAGALKLVKLPAIVSLVGPAAAGLEALGGGAIIATNSLVPLVGAIGVAAPALSTLVQGAGTAVIGIKGLGAAFESLDAIAKETDPSERLKKIAEAEKEVGKQSLEFAAYIQNTVVPAFKDMQRATAESMIPGFTKGIQSALPFLKTLQGELTKTGAIIGNIGASMGRWIGSDTFNKQFAQVGEANRALLESFGAAGETMGRSLMTLFQASGPLYAAADKWTQQLANWMNDRIGSGVATGKLEAWLDRSIAKTEQWGRVLKNLGGGIAALFSASNESTGGFMAWMEEATARFKEFMQTMKGNGELGDFFKSLQGPLAAAGVLLKNLLADLHNLGTGDFGMANLTAVIQTLDNSVRPALMRLINGVTPEMTKAVVEGLASIINFLSSTNFGVVTAFVKALTQVLDVVSSIIQTFPGLKTILPLLAIFKLASVAGSLLTGALGRLALAFAPVIAGAQASAAAVLGASGNYTAAAAMSNAAAASMARANGAAAAGAAAGAGAVGLLTNALALLAVTYGVAIFKSATFGGEFDKAKAKTDALTGSYKTSTSELQRMQSELQANSDWLKSQSDGLSGYLRFLGDTVTKGLGFALNRQKEIAQAWIENEDALNKNYALLHATDQAITEVAASTAFTEEQVRELAGTLDLSGKSYLEQKRAIEEALTAMYSYEGQLKNINAAALSSFDSLNALTSSIANNGATLDANTAAGLRNINAVQNMADAALNLSSAYGRAGASVSSVIGVTFAHRDAAVAAMTAMGIEKDAAIKLAASLFAIPPEVMTRVRIVIQTVMATSSVGGTPGAALSAWASSPEALAQYGSREAALAAAAQASQWTDAMDQYGRDASAAATKAAQEAATAISKAVNGAVSGATGAMNSGMDNMTNYLNNYPTSGGGGAAAAAAQAIKNLKAQLLKGVTKEATSSWANWTKVFGGMITEAGKISKAMRDKFKGIIQPKDVKVRGLFIELNKVQKKIDAAISKLEGLKQAKAQLIESLKSTFQNTVGLSNIDAMTEDTRKAVDGLFGVFIGQAGRIKTAKDILKELEAQFKALQDLDKYTTQLRSMGLTETAVQEIMGMGSEAGTALAKALIQGGQSAVKQANAIYTGRDALALDMAKRAGAAMYDAGIKAAEGLVKGLQSQKKAIEQTLIDIAMAIQKALKKALGISSPSKVTAKIGMYTGLGLIKGLESTQAEVDKAFAALIKPLEAPSGLQMAVTKGITGGLDSVAPTGLTAPQSGQVITVAKDAIQVTVPITSAEDPEAIRVAVEDGVNEAFRELVQQLRSR